MSAPTGAATAQHSITSGTSGTTTTLASGAISERRSKLTSTIGNVVSCAASVRAIGSRRTPGRRDRRSSMPRPNQISPAVASSES
jgi:hypothetical protein